MVKKHLKEVVRKYNTEDKESFDYVLTQNERNLPLPENLYNKFISNISFRDISFYPNLDPLKTKIKEYVKCNNIFLVPGSDVGIKTIFEMLDLKGKEVLTTNYFFPMYKVYSEIYQAKIVTANYSTFNFNIYELFEKINKDTQLIIIANPNSPIGDTYTLDQIRTILDKGITTVIDEAYIELSDAKSAVELIEEYDNLYVTRTFSKGFGAAGCRVGYICSNEQNIGMLDKLRLMFEVSGIAAKYCSFILDNIEYYQKYLKDLLSEKKKFIRKLEMKHNFRIFDTKSSWFFLQKNRETEKFIEENNINLRETKLDFLDNSIWFKFNYDLKFNGK